MKMNPRTAALATIVKIPADRAPAEFREAGPAPISITSAPAPRRLSSQFRRVTATHHPGAR